MTTSAALSREELLELARERFTYALAVSESAFESIGATTRLRLLLNTSFVEVELDWREQAVFVLVGLLTDGEVPDGYYVDHSGKPVRWHLAEVLSQHGNLEGAACLRSVLRGSGRKAMRQQIEAFADELESMSSGLPAMVASMGPAKPRRSST